MICLLTDGEIYSWGKSARGRLGRTEGDTGIPQAIMFGDDHPFTVVSICSNHGSTLMATKRKYSLLQDMHFTAWNDQIWGLQICFCVLGMYIFKGPCQFSLLEDWVRNCECLKFGQFLSTLRYALHNMKMYRISFLYIAPTVFWSDRTINIPAKPLYKRGTVSVHINHFYCMGICDKLIRHLYMLTYIYLNVDECWLTSSMP